MNSQWAAESRDMPPPPPQLSQSQLHTEMERGDDDDCALQPPTMTASPKASTRKSGASTAVRRSGGKTRSSGSKTRQRSSRDRVSSSAESLSSSVSSSLCASGGQTWSLDATPSRSVTASIERLTTEDSAGSCVDGLYHDPCDK